MAFPPYLSVRRPSGLPLLPLVWPRLSVCFRRKWIERRRAQQITETGKRPAGRGLRNTERENQVNRVSRHPHHPGLPGWPRGWDLPGFYHSAYRKQEQLIDVQNRTV